MSTTFSTPAFSLKRIAEGKKSGTVSAAFGDLWVRWIVIPRPVAVARCCKICHTQDVTGCVSDASGAQLTFFAPLEKLTALLLFDDLITVVRVSTLAFHVPMPSSHSP